MPKNILKKHNPLALTVPNNIMLGLSVGIPVALHFYPELYLLKRAMLAMNTVNFLSNATVFATGVYGLVKHTESKTIESIMISFGMLGMTGFALSKSYTEQPLSKYYEKLQQNREYTTKNFSRLSPDKQRLNIHYLRNRAAEEYFPLSKHKSDLFLKSYSLSRKEVLVPPEGTFFQSMQSTMTTVGRFASMMRDPEINLSKYIEEDLVLRRNVPLNSNVNNMSYEFHTKARHLLDLIDTQQMYYRLRFSNALFYDAVLNGMNAGFAFAGGVSGLYNYFHKNDQRSNLKLFL